MKNFKNCPICKGSELETITKTYTSNNIDKETKEKIVVPKIKTLHCKNPECNFYWLPYEEEVRVKEIIDSRRL